MICTDLGKSFSYGILLIHVILIIHSTCPKLDLETVFEVFIHFISNKRAKHLQDDCTFHITDMWI